MQQLPDITWISAAPGWRRCRTGSRRRRTRRARSAGGERRSWMDPRLGASFRSRADRSDRQPPRRQAAALACANSLFHGRRSWWVGRAAARLPRHRPCGPSVRRPRRQTPRTRASGSLTRRRGALGSTSPFSGRHAFPLHRSHASACSAWMRTPASGSSRSEISAGYAVSSTRWSSARGQSPLPPACAAAVAEAPAGALREREDRETADRSPLDEQRVRRHPGSTHPPPRLRERPAVQLAFKHAMADRSPTRSIAVRRPRSNRRSSRGTGTLPPGPIATARRHRPIASLRSRTGPGAEPPRMR